MPTLGTAVMLSLRLNFQNTNDQIMLGAVGVTIAQRASVDVLSGAKVNLGGVIGYLQREPSTRR